LFLLHSTSAAQPYPLSLHDALPISSSSATSDRRLTSSSVSSFICWRISKCSIISTPPSCLPKSGSGDLLIRSPVNLRVFDVLSAPVLPRNRRVGIDMHRPDVLGHKLADVSGLVPCQLHWQRRNQFVVHREP